MNIQDFLKSHLADAKTFSVTKVIDDIASFYMKAKKGKFENCLDVDISILALRSDNPSVSKLLTQSQMNFQKEHNNQSYLKSVLLAAFNLGREQQARHINEKMNEFYSTKWLSTEFLSRDEVLEFADFYKNGISNIDLKDVEIHYADFMLRVAKRKWILHQTKEYKEKYFLKNEI